MESSARYDGQRRSREKDQERTGIQIRRFDVKIIEESVILSEVEGYTLHDVQSDNEKYKSCPDASGWDFFKLFLFFCALHAPGLPDHSGTKTPPRTSAG